MVLVYPLFHQFGYRKVEKYNFLQEVYWKEYDVTHTAKTAIQRNFYFPPKVTKTDDTSRLLTNKKELNQIDSE